MLQEKVKNQGKTFSKHNWDMMLLYATAAETSSTAWELINMGRGDSEGQ